MSSSIIEKGIAQLAELIENKQIKPSEIVSKFLDRVKQVDNSISAFIDLDRDRILSQAYEADRRQIEGKRLSRYDGIPISIKDIINVEGETCRCCSKILEGYVAPYDATVIKKLKSKGFIIFGRNNMDEFAMGSSTENSAYFKTSNPWDLERVPGGSSGGSAAAVASLGVPGSLGTDTGGSVRQPASFCGVVGVKPTYGRVSRYGIVAFASSLDQVGPIAGNVIDAAILLDTISGEDEKDATSVNSSCYSNCYDALMESEKKGIRSLNIGVPYELLEIEGLDDEVKYAFLHSLDLLKDYGFKLKNISFPYMKHAIATYYIIATAECSANLARFDGIRYGRRSKNYNELSDLYFKSRGEGFGDEVIRRILLGTFVLSSGYYDAYYRKAQKVRILIKREFEKLFNICDLILTPTTPSVAFKKGAISDPVQMYLEDIFTVSINLAGITAVSVPAGLGKDSKMPIGIQFIGPRFGEELILKVARNFEKISGFNSLKSNYFRTETRE